MQSAFCILVLLIVVLHTYWLTGTYTSIFSPNEVSRTTWYTRLELYTVLIPGKMASVHIVRGIYIPPLRRRRQER